MGQRTRSILQRAGRTVRDAWLIAGLTLLLFVVLEGLFRLQRVVRVGVQGAGPATLAAAGGEGASVVSRRFDPYRAWWPDPATSALINIDSLGRRFTPQPWLTAPAARRVLMLGGSTMWGWTHADSTTIPTFVARALHDRGLQGVEVVNLAQSTYNATQELITLLLELRRGDVPDVVVFLDGHNEVSTAWASGVAGAIANQHLAEQAYRRGRRGFMEELIGLGRHSALVTRIAQAVLGPGPGAARPGPEICPDIARYHAGLARSARAWGEAFGFAVAYFWQPVLATTEKPLTDRERQLEAPPGYRELLRACAAATDARMAEVDGLTYHPLHGIFDTDTATVYTDDVGHLTRHGNAVVAERIAEVITPWLLAREADAGR